MKTNYLKTVVVIILSLLLIFPSGALLVSAEANDGNTSFILASDPNVEVNIPDENLKSAIIFNLGITTDIVTQSDMAGLTSLFVFLDDIEDLTGLEYAVNLNKLNLFGNKITDISPLSTLTHLTCLNLSDNIITDISPLSSLINLTYLDLGGNNISDISSLSSLINLIELDIRENNITLISSLATLTKLTTLNLSFNNITDLSPLASLTSLIYLNLDNNNITNLSSLAPLINLELLYLNSNNISNVTPLVTLLNLVYLGIGENAITDISPLAAVTSLTGINLENNALADISSLTSLINMDLLFLMDNNISDISSLASLSDLSYVGLDNNNLVNISPLSALSFLQSISLTGNDITSLAPFIQTGAFEALKNLCIDRNLIEIDAETSYIETLENELTSFCYLPQRIMSSELVDSESRLAGESRTGTAVEISKAWKQDDSAYKIFIVNGDNFADALASVPLAYRYSAPILMIRQPLAELDTETIAELNRLDSEHDATIYLLGGTFAVGPQVEVQLVGMGYETEDIERISGDNRYLTAIEMAELTGYTKAILVNGTTYPDALGIGPAAALNDYCILFTDDGDTVRSETLEYIEENIEEVVIVGGTSVIPDGVQTQLVNLLGTGKVSRIAGVNRVATALAIAEEFFPTSEGVSTIFVSTGRGYADALAGGPMAAAYYGPILLVDTNKPTVPQDVLDYITDSGAQDVVILGGDDAVSDAIREQVQGAVATP